MNPRFITPDSAQRRAMYLADMRRKDEEERFDGPKEAFLAGLGMVFRIGRAREEDLRRAEELTLRTNQLNSTGYTYSYEELAAFAVSPSHRLLVAGLDDRYGSYGKIGLALLETADDVWRIKLLLMSCRVMSRGVGAILINHLRNEARRAGRRLTAEFIDNGRNRMMYMTLKFNHFRETGRNGDCVLLENDLGPEAPFPDYVTVQVD
jgi:FkbH-like protein